MARSWLYIGYTSFTFKKISFGCFIRIEDKYILAQISRGGQGFEPVIIERTVQSACQTTRARNLYESLYNRLSSKCQHIDFNHTTSSQLHSHRFHFTTTIQLPMCTLHTHTQLPTLLLQQETQ